MKNKIISISILSSFSALALIALAIFLCFLVRADSKELVSAKNSMISLGAQLNETHSFIAKYEGYHENIDKLRNMFVDVENPVDFIRFLEEKASALDMTSQVHLPAGQGGPATHFNLAASGRLQNIISFIKDIELGPYLVEVKNLSIASAKGVSESSADVFDLNLSIKALEK